MNRYRAVTICHLFYPSISEVVIQKLKLIDDEKALFLFNIQNNSLDHRTIMETVRRNFPDSHMLVSPNKGRDIGGKFLLIDLMIQLNIDSDYTLIIHDKKSPHLEKGSNWRDELFKVIKPSTLEKIFDIFKNNPEVGIVGAANYIQNEHKKIDNKFACSSNRQIKELLIKYNIETNDYHFIAGNIFWIRTNLLRAFFEKRAILEIRSDLEAGNALDFNRGTYIHAWERIMSWIATSQGYKIHGI